LSCHVTPKRSNPSEPGAEPVIIEGHVDVAVIAESIEKPLGLVVVVAFDPERHGRSKRPFMTDRTVGAAEVATGQTERRRFDLALGSNVPRAVAVDLDELKIVEDWSHSGDSAFSVSWTAPARRSAGSITCEGAGA
jgi:hypothetical protein